MPSGRWDFDNWKTFKSKQCVLSCNAFCTEIEKARHARLSL